MHGLRFPWDESRFGPLPDLPLTWDTLPDWGDSIDLIREGTKAVFRRHGWDGDIQVTSSRRLDKPPMFSSEHQKDHVWFEVTFAEKS